MAARDYGQYGGITRALELVGERWALLIVRDLLVGPRRYGELAAGLPRIPSNILAARLKELQAAGVLRRVPRSRVIVYELTPYGRARARRARARRLGLQGDGRSRTSRSSPRLDDHRPPHRLPAAGGSDAAGDRVRRALRSRRAAHPGGRLHPRREAWRRTVDLAFAAGPGIRRLISGELAPDRAIATGVVEVLRGRGDLLDRFASTFHLAA